MRLGETRRENGSALQHLTTGNFYEEAWALPSADAVLDQGHEYKEFRWAEVLDLPEPIALADVGAWVVRYPLARRASFSSADARLDAVWRLGEASIFNTALDVNTDSNTRPPAWPGKIDTHTA